MTSPKVSVIMGVYNAEYTLSSSIESILEQSYTDWEFIICDDHSADHSWEIACTYAKTCQQIRVIRNSENLGLAASLNHCLKHARGEYIARMDADDLSLPERFAVQVKFLDDHPQYAVVGTGMVSFDGHGDRGIRFCPTIPKQTDLVYNTPFMHATIMMRAEAYRQLNGYRVLPYTRRTEDVDLWFRFFATRFTGYNLQQVLYRVREDPSAYQRRRLRYYIDAVRLSLHGFRMLNLPWYYYLYLAKPLLAGFTPKPLIAAWHRIHYRERRANT